MNHFDWRCFAGGGNFDNGVNCGARCLNTNNNPWNSNGNIGLRCVCDNRFFERAARQLAVTVDLKQGVSSPVLAPLLRAELKNPGVQREYRFDRKPCTPFF